MKVSIISRSRLKTSNLIRRPDAEALIVGTEWNLFKEIDLRKIKDAMKVPVIIDGRNIYQPKKMRAAGFQYISVGR